MAVLFVFVLLSLLFINFVIELPIDLLNLLHPSRWLLGAIALVILAWCLDDQ
ncbi:hypothetical protein H6F67_08430 [Microcoleus sp. FACHB-1515]|uniref:hypothetical protein n=1 Tax=Cyanophyceae TaxID=3028117 RepID=UPI001687759A|nr:hypothetical protein [Microcoleus sp. FACHB-1515]MBD2089879.1 hypothetical protein [Microcoleus sp. FACHB-1515]